MTTRFAHFDTIQDAFRHQAAIEQAKGILMGRLAIDAPTAHRMLLDHARRTGHPVGDVAAALIQTHRLI